MVTFLIFLIIIMTESYYEALRYYHHETTKSGIVEGFHRSFVYALVCGYLAGIPVPFIVDSGFNWWQLAGLFVLLRFGIFRPLYNFFGKVPYLYRGTLSKVYDRAFWGFIDWTKQPPEILVPTLEFLSTFTSIVILLYYGN